MNTSDTENMEGDDAALDCHYHPYSEDGVEIIIETVGLLVTVLVPFEIVSGRPQMLEM